MATTKTKVTAQSVEAFIQSFVADQQKQTDSHQLIKLLEQWTGEAPRMWGSSIIGFGSYHYQYASGHQGDAPVLAFSPRKAAISLYLYSHTPESATLLPRLGKFKMSKACIYIKKLADIDMHILQEICRETIQYINQHHECSCRMK